MRTKYEYSINGRVVSRKEFVEELACYVGKTTEIANGIGMTVADYDKAERTIKNWQRTRCRGLVTSHTSFFMREVSA